MDIVSLLWWLIGIFSFIIVMSVFGFVWWIKTYKFKFRIYEDISGLGYEEAKTVRGRKLKKPGTMNEFVYWIPAYQLYLSAYGRKMGKNMYYYFIGPDGWFYNCVMGDLDGTRGIIDIEPVDKDIRAFHSNNAKNINERYNKPKNWPIVLMSFTIIFVVLIFIIGNYITTKKTNEGLQTIGGQLEASKELTQTAERLVLAVEKLVNNGGVRTGLLDVPISNVTG